MFQFSLDGWLFEASHGDMSLLRVAGPLKREYPDFNTQAQDSNVHNEGSTCTGLTARVLGSFGRMRIGRTYQKQFI
jgi:hypothetical protein